MTSHERAAIVTVIYLECVENYSGNIRVWKNITRAHTHTHKEKKDVFIRAVVSQRFACIYCGKMKGRACVSSV